MLSVAQAPKIIGPHRNTQCYDTPMPNVRFTISTASEMKAAIKAHAEAAGMDVSAYMIAAAAAQMARDDAVRATFATIDALNQAALEQASELPDEEYQSFSSLTPQEQAWVRDALASALGTDTPDTP